MSIENFKIKKESINVGDELKYLTLSNGNVTVLHSDKTIGKIKIIHELPFIGRITARLSVKAIYSSSSFIKRIFVKVDVIENSITNHMQLKEKYEVMRGVKTHRFL